jgi:hypothetical protein
VAPVMRATRLVKALVEDRVGTGKLWRLAVDLTSSA